MVVGRPEDALPGDTVIASRVIDWPRMSGQSVVQFQRFTGIKNYNGFLVRKGKWIFCIEEFNGLARCLYAHERNF